MVNRLSKYITKIFPAVFLCIAVFAFLPGMLKGQESDVDFLKNWEYTDGTAEGSSFMLPAKLRYDENSVSEIRTVIPESADGPQLICFWTFSQSVEVYVGGKSVYVHDNSDGSAFGAAPSPGWNMISVDDAAGEPLTLRLHSPYNYSNKRLSEVVYGDPDDVYSWVEHSFGIYHLLDISYIWIGILLILLSFILKFEKRFKDYLRYASLTLILFSIYLLTGTKSLPLYFINDYACGFLCYGSILALPIPFTLYVRTRVARKKRMVSWCNILAALNSVFVAAAFLLHAAGAVDIHRCMPIGILLLVTSVASGFVFAVYYCVKEQSSHMFSKVFSLVLIILVMAIEYLQFYHINTLPFDTGFLSHVCAAVVIVIETVVFMYYIYGESKRRSTATDENKSLQLQMLTGQISPHFILNTIGAIRNLIREDGERAEDLLYEFSKYVRNSLEQKDYSKPRPFPEELSHIEAYLKLEMAKFGDRISVEYDIGVREFWILPLTVQPFVENAVKHGLSAARNGGVLKISTEAEKSCIVIRIEDTGVGFDYVSKEQIMKEKRSVGMRSAIMRLERVMDASVEIKSSTETGASGTSVTIRLPIKKRG